MSAENDNRRNSSIIAAAIIGAALILSWGISSDEPRYQIASSGDGVVRMDTDSGEMIACNVQGCAKVEQASRSKRFGPLTIEVGDDAEKKAPPKPSN